MDKIYNDAKTPIFSTRELEVADYISRGFSEKEIADKLHISRFTVNNHTRHIRANNERYGKCDCPTVMKSQACKKAKKVLLSMLVNHRL